MSYTINMGETIWRATFSKILTKDDLLEIARRIESLREGGTDPNGVIDTRRLSGVDIDFDTIATIVLEMQSHPAGNGMRIAMLAETPVQCGFAKTLQMLLIQRHINVQLFFEDEEDALDWISK